MVGTLLSTSLFTWKLDATDVSRMAGHANYRTTLDMYVGTTAGILDRARTATETTTPGHDLAAEREGRLVQVVQHLDRRVQAWSAAPWSGSD